MVELQILVVMLYTYELVEQQYETPVLINSDADLITLSIQLGGVELQQLVTH
jgi:hypothetical protein